MIPHSYNTGSHCNRWPQGKVIILQHFENIAWFHTSQFHKIMKNVHHIIFFFRAQGYMVFLNFMFLSDPKIFRHLTLFGRVFCRSTHQAHVDIIALYTNSLHSSAAPFRCVFCVLFVHLYIYWFTGADAVFRFICCRRKFSLCVYEQDFVT